MHQSARRIEGADEFRSSVGEMCEALRLERDEYRNRRRVDVVQLGRGRLVALAAAAQPTYRYEKQRPKVLPYPRGFSVIVRFDDASEVWAMVLGQTRRTIDLHMEPRGAETPKATIHWDPAWLVDALERKTASVLPSPIARTLLGCEVAAPLARDPLLLPHATLDDEQRRALVSLVASSCGLLEGPAGTGKTRVLVALIEELRARRESILVVAPSHAACDVVTERLLPLAEGNDGLRLGKVVRWGTVQTPVLRRHAASDRGPAGNHGLWIYDGADAEAARAAAREADVLITTTARCFVGNGLLRSFATVVVDEGGMCSIPTVLSAIGYARRRGIVAGDSRQLGPIIHARGEPSVDRWLRCNSFDLAEKTGTVPVARLCVQYRMAARITSIVSRLSYGGSVVPAPEVLARPIAECALGRDNVFLVDTSGLSGGWFDSPGHARVVGALVSALHQAGEPQVAGTLVLARYRRQVARINREVRATRVAGRTVLVTTVHSAQGSEAPTVILDLIPGTPDFLGDYLVDTRATDDGARILTVGLSRAKDRLIVLADLRFLSTRLPRQAHARRLLQLLHAEATIIRASDVLAQWGPGPEGEEIIRSAAPTRYGELESPPSPLFDR